MNSVTHLQKYSLTVKLLVLTALVGVLLGLGGLSRTSAQSSTVTVAPGTNIQNLVSSRPEGTTFILQAGVHRMQTITPRNNQTFIGENGTVLSGARVLTGWQREGNLWYVTGQTQEGRPHGECRSSAPRCRHPEDLFFNSTPLLHVASLNDVTAGRWYFDYGRDRIYIANNPTGNHVETSVNQAAFTGTARNVTIRNMTVERYASRAQYGAISAENSTNWTIDNVTLQWNHGAGIRGGNGMRLTNSRINNNGQLGVRSYGTNVLIENNEIAYNNWAGFDDYWEAGGTKFSFTDGMIVRNNYVHHNEGPGLWTDIDNINTLYEYNTITYNKRSGIYHEISYSSVIRYNVVKFNGLGGHDNWLWGSQILIATSSDSEVYSNEVVVDAREGNGIGIINQYRGSGEYGPWRSYNNHVYDNLIVYTGSNGVSGIASDYDIERFWQESNNRFDRNTYYVINTGYSHWRWQDRVYNWNNFRAQGPEANGQMRQGTPPAGVSPVIPQGGTATPTSTLPIALTASPTAPIPTPTAQPQTADLSVASLVLINADTNQPIGLLTNNLVINLATVGTSNLNVVAQTNPVTVGSVRFTLNGNVRHENGAPYAMWGNDGSDYYAWTPANGSYALSVQPFTSSNGSGVPGTTTTVNFTVINQASSVPTSTRPPATATPVPPTATFTNTPVPPTATFTNTPVPPTATPVPPTATFTNTPVPPTATPVPPTATFTNTPVPPTATFTNTPVPPTATPVPPTATFTNTPVPSPNHSISALVLINADTDLPIGPLADGAILNLATVGRNLHVLAQTSPNAVGSVSFTLNGSVRYENEAPYALWSNDGDDFFPWTPRLGANTLIVRAFTDVNGSGLGSAEVVVNFTVIEQAPATATFTSTPVPPTSTPVPPTAAPQPTQPPAQSPDIAIASLTLINADTDQPIGPLTNGLIINVFELGTRNINVRADTAPATVGSVRFTLNGSTRHENTAPYALWSNTGDDYHAWEAPNGQHTLTIQAFAGPNGAGISSYPMTILFSVVNRPPATATPVPPTATNTPQPTATFASTAIPTEEAQPAPVNPNQQSVTGFVLINADTNQPIGALTDGATVNLEAIGTRNLNIDVQTDPGIVASVRVALNNYSRVENAAPYSVWGDIAGDFNAWTPQPGAYTVSAQPFNQRDGRGTAGGAMTISFTVIERAEDLPGSGLSAQYFDEVNFTGQNISRVDERIDFNWGTGAPVNGFGGDTFSVRWLGYVVPLFSETYTFYTFADDGTRLWINGQLIIDDWTRHSAREMSGNITLEAGRPYEIRLEYFEQTGRSQVSLRWSSEGQAKQVIPTSQLYPVSVSVVSSAPIIGQPGGPSQIQSPRSAPQQPQIALQPTATQRTSPAATATRRPSTGGTGGTAPRPAPTNRPSSGGSAPQSANLTVARIILINADTDREIGPLTNGMTIDMAAMPTRNLNARAVAGSSAVDSIRVDVNGDVHFQNEEPYAIFHDLHGDYHPWTPQPGTYTITLTPYSDDNGNGAAGTPLTVRITVVNNQTAPAQPAQPRPTQAPPVQPQPQQPQQPPAQPTAIVVNLPTFTPAPVLGVPTITPQPTITPLTLPADAQVGAAGQWLMTTGSWEVNPLDNTQWMVDVQTQESYLIWDMPLDLRTSIAPLLTFQSRFSGANFGARVEVTTDSIASIETVEGGLSASAAINWQSLGAVVPTADFAEITLDLSAYRGQIVHLRWVWTPFLPLPLGALGEWMIHTIGVDESPATPEGTPETTVEAPEITPETTTEAPEITPTAESTVEAPTATPTPETTVEAPTAMPTQTPTQAPTATTTPAPLAELTLVSVCAATWQVINPNLTAVSFTWEVVGIDVPSVPINATSGDQTFFFTSAAVGEPETVIIRYDLGAGEVIEQTVSNTLICP